MIEVPTGTGVASIRLEYTQDGGQRWRTEKSKLGADISHSTGLTGTVVLEWVKNETPKNKLYRWNAVTFNRATSATVTWHLSNHNPNRTRLFGDVWSIVSEDIPVSGTDGDGAGFAGAGSIYYCTGSISNIYRNDGNATMPIWKAM